MIVFPSTLRIARRPRRIPSVAALVRALGTVRVTDQPATWPTRPTQAAPHSSYCSGARSHSPRSSNGTPRTSC